MRYAILTLLVLVAGCGSERQPVTTFSPLSNSSWIRSDDQVRFFFYDDKELYLYVRQPSGEFPCTACGAFRHWAFDGTTLTLTTAPIPPNEPVVEACKLDRTGETEFSFTCSDGVARKFTREEKTP